MIRSLVVIITIGVACIWLMKDLTGIRHCVLPFVQMHRFLKNQKGLLWTLLFWWVVVLSTVIGAAVYQDVGIWIVSGLLFVLITPTCLIWYIKRLVLKRFLKRFELPGRRS